MKNQSREASMTEEELYEKEDYDEDMDELELDETGRHYNS